jgi:3-hydroxybutyryl-CoA dehydrogenase
LPKGGEVRAIGQEFAAAVEQADVVIEAASENLSLKQALFAEIARLAPPDAILASNSSSFMPSEVGSKVQRRNRAVVAHYFNPPHLLAIVEIVRGPETDEEVVATMRDLYLRIGKRHGRRAEGGARIRGQPPPDRPVPRGAFRRGAGHRRVAHVDTVVRYLFGRRLAAAGPFEVADAAGADLWATVATNLMPDIAMDTEITPFYQGCPSVERRV